MAAQSKTKIVGIGMGVEKCRNKYMTPKTYRDIHILSPLSLYYVTETDRVKKPITPNSPRNLHSWSSFLKLASFVVIELDGSVDLLFSWL